MRVVTVLLAGMALLLALLVACSDDPYPVQPSSNSSLLSFALAGVAGSIDTTVVPHRIDVVLPEGQSLTSLIATFALPAGARAYVNTVEQKSGTSALSYDKGYLSWVIKAADGALREYRVYAWAGAVSSASSTSSSSMTSSSTSSSTASSTSSATSGSGGSSASSVSSSATSIDPNSQIGNVLITEWGDAGTGVDYIELRNFSGSSVTLDSTLTIVLGSAFGTTVTLAQYGTGDDPASYTTFTSLSLSPGEVILLVESDVTIANIQSIKGYGVPADVKFFISSESTLIGTGDRLSDNPAKLKSGFQEWSLTAWPWTAGTSTYSKLANTFVFGTDSTQDATKWVNGTSTIRSPGVWP